MLVSDSGRIIRPEEKAVLPIVVNDLGRTTVSIISQRLNAFSPIDTIESGSFMSDILLQLPNALLPNVLRPEGSLTEVSKPQSENALSSMDSTESGMVIVIKLQY